MPPRILYFQYYIMREKKVKPFFPPFSIVFSEKKAKKRRLRNEPEPSELSMLFSAGYHSRGTPPGIFGYYFFLQVPALSPSQSVPALRFGQSVQLPQAVEASFFVPSE